ncbi:MAG: ribosome biogenesis factor YjgA [Desulfovibrio sp.]
MARVNNLGADYDESDDTFEHNSQFTDYPEMADRSKSRSQVKRELKELQDLGIRLTKLKKPELRRLDLPQTLNDAIIECQRLKREALRRQHQYIGSLMREIDADLIRDAVDNIQSGKQHDQAQFHEVERWREELLSGNNTLLGEIIDTCPGANAQHIRQLIRNANTEQKKGKAPKSSRALFKYLRELIHDRDAANNAESE